MKNLLNTQCYTKKPSKVAMLGVFAALLCGKFAQADTVNIAVASNIAPAMEVIKSAFELQSAHRINLIKSSTGKLYAQIRNGAPYDMFLSADQERPRLLEEEGFAIPGTRRTYAIGQLALWSRDSNGELGESYLIGFGSAEKLALANPRLAPYGVAAMEVLSSLGLEGEFEGRVVMGENVGQTFQFVYSGAARAGFVAFSQLQILADGESARAWLIPNSLYQPIRQDMVLLRDSAAARSVQQFMQSQRGTEILQSAGYLLN